MRFYKSAALTANQNDGVNLVAGIKDIEWLPRNTRLRLSGDESLTTGGAKVTLIVGGRTLLYKAALGGQNRSPVYPDDVIGEWGAPRGSQVILTIEETLGGTPTYFLQVDADPVG